MRILDCHLIAYFTLYVDVLSQNVFNDHSQAQRLIASPPVLGVLRTRVHAYQL